MTTDNKFLIDDKLAVPVLTLEPQPINLCFNNDDGEEIGKFEYDKEKKQWYFEGDADESAKIFVKFCMAHFQSAINGDRDGLLDPIDEYYTDRQRPPVDEEVESDPEKVWPEHLAGKDPGDPDWMDVRVHGKFESLEKERCPNTPYGRDGHTWVKSGNPAVVHGEWCHYCGKIRD